jgi:hypothetical protein
MRILFYDGFYHARPWRPSEIKARLAEDLAPIDPERSSAVRVLRRLDGWHGLSILTDWEREFLGSVTGLKTLSIRQEAKVWGIFAKVHDWAHSQPGGR